MHRRLGTVVALVLALSACSTVPEPDTIEQSTPTAPLLAATPPMGWNSWYGFFCDEAGERFNEASLLAIADKMVEPGGLRDHGYDYLLLDDCWQAKDRDANGRVVPDPVKFKRPMAEFVQAVHDRGLKVGLYTDIGTKTCAGRPGSAGHEFVDAATFASWGVDFIKVDWCDTPGYVARDHYQIFRDAIEAAGRPMTYNICNWGQQDPWTWAPTMSQLWRTTGDISAPHPPGTPPDHWSGIINNLDGNARHAAAAGPGRWNDPDYLQVGLGGETDTEYRSQMSLWSLMAAPLVISPDVRAWTESTPAYQIVTAPEVIAVDQDPAGVQGTLVRDDDGLQVWSKPLARPGERAVVLFNRRDQAASITARWADVGLDVEHGVCAVRDLWEQTDLACIGATFTTNVEPHASVMLKVTGRELDAPKGEVYLSDLDWSYVASGWGPAERDRSNGGAGVDGGRLSVAGKTYDKGVGVHSESRITRTLGGHCSRFRATVGIDDEVGDRGGVVFRVLADGEERFDSGPVRGRDPAVPVEVALDGAKVLELVVSGGGTSSSNDHADWADARLTCDP